MTYANFLISVLLIFAPLFGQTFSRVSIDGGHANPHRVIPGDLDNDGDQDLVILTTTSAPDEVDIFCLENVNATFTVADSVTIEFNYSASGRGLAVGDLDGDGDLDVAATDQSTDISWWLNDGDPFDGSGFGSRNTVNPGGGASRMETIEIADMDGANNADMLVPYLLPSGTSNIAFWANDGSATPSFSSGENIINAATLSFPSYVISADIDNDGDLDAVAVQNGAGTVTWYENDGAVTWPAANITTTHTGVAVLSAKDVDRDGDIDIIAGANNANSVSDDSLIIYYNNSNGASWTPAYMGFAADITYIAGRDLDGDGDIDIVVSTDLSFSAPDSLAVYSNNGSNSFTRSTIISGYSGARSLIPVSIDSDGDPDLVSVALGDSDIDWWASDAEDRNNSVTGAPAFFWSVAGETKVTIDFVSTASGVVTVFFDSEAVPGWDGVIGAGIDHVARNGFFIITTTKTVNGSNTVDIGFRYDNLPGDWYKIDDENDLRIAWWDGDSWEVPSGSSQNVFPGQDSISVTGIDNLGSGFFVLASATSDNALPVQLSLFEAQIGPDGVVLDWVTDSELNNLGFELWRAIDNSGDFQMIASYATHPALAGAGNANQRNSYSYPDESVEHGHRYDYLLWDVTFTGERSSHGPLRVVLDDAGPAADSYVLRQNYPNPFNPVTNVEFAIRNPAFVTLTVYDIAGRKVATVVNEFLPAGEHRAVWNGTDDGGIPMATGIYLYRLRAGGYMQTHKMMLLR